ncbi:insulinase family protein, partial [Staphylococcus pasteuri]
EAQLALAKKVLISQRLEAQDRPKSIIEILNNNVLLDEDLTHYIFAQQVQAVTKDDVIQLAQNTQVETIYTLTKREED